jgi:hypothetical protein
VKRPKNFAEILEILNFRLLQSTECPSAFAAASSACYGRRALLGCFYMKDAAAVSVSQAKAMQHLTLSNGVKIPVVGSGCAFGNWTGRAPLAL